MDQFVFLISFFVLATVGTVGNNMLLPAEIYWHKVLPNTPMPNALQDILHPDRVGVDVNADNLSYAQNNAVSDGVDEKSYAQNTAVPGNKNYGNFVDEKTYAQNTAVPGNKNYGNFVDEKTYAQNTAVPGNKNYRNLVDEKSYAQNTGTVPRKYRNVDEKSTHYEYSIMSLFFLEKDMQAGATKSIDFKRNALITTFVPRQVANAIPFSSAKLSEILHHFSIKPDTLEAKAIKMTLDECEMPENEGEDKFCATSLESLVELSMLTLGTRNVQALSTIVSKEKIPKQTYKVASSGLQRLPGSNSVACHHVMYPFMVYYCHLIKGTKAYKVTLTGKDGTKVEAVAICHTETSTWNPKHAAFQVLKVKPGTLPICHMLAQDSLLWTPTN